jgi:hypothetical protein
VRRGRDLADTSRDGLVNRVDRILSNRKPGGLWERRARTFCSHNPPGVPGAEAIGGGSLRAAAELPGVRCEPGTPALRVETGPIVAVSMHELRVFTRSAEDARRASALCLFAGRLHPGTVSHLGELAHRSNGQRPSVESPHRFGVEHTICDAGMVRSPMH